MSHCPEGFSVHPLFQIKLAFSSCACFCNRVCVSWLSFAEQVIYSPGSFIRLVMKKYETMGFLSGVGEDGSLLIVPRPWSVVKAPRHFAWRIGLAPSQLASDQAVPSSNIKQPLPSPPSLPVAGDTGSQSSLDFHILYRDSLKFSCPSEIHVESTGEENKL